MPFSRRTRTAASMSPFVSWSARLQSIIGAPVWSRSSFTSAAEISAIGLGLLRDRLVARRHTLVVALGYGLLVRALLAVARGSRREVRRSRLLLSGRDAVGDDAHDQIARADRVVVPRDDVVGFVGVAGRIDDSNRGQPGAPRLADGELLLAQVDDEDRFRLTLHVGHAAEILLELLELVQHRDPLLGGQQLELVLVLQPP